MEDMEEIDLFIYNNNVNNMIKDYLEKDIKPDLSKLSKQKNEIKHVPKLLNNTFIDHNLLYPEYNNLYENSINEINTLQSKIINLENNIKIIMNENNNKNEINNNECPVCDCDLSVNSYLTGICGHKYCGKCCFENFTKNKNTGSLCPLCRVSII